MSIHTYFHTIFSKSWPVYLKKNLFWCGLLLLFSLLSFCSEQKSDDSEDGSNEKSPTHVSNSDPQTPEEEQKGFDLPPDFEIQLFASEPDINKPMNIAFDAKGRLWVTHSLEYPYPSEEERGKDQITILEDTDKDGKADAFTTFANDMNIPIGILPIQNGAIGYTIPYIYKFSDENGDNQYDAQKRLYGAFGYKDTHGMVNSLTRSFDGWIYACHGFANNSAVSSIDGDSVYMESGHTFRFTRDGENIEVMTTGRVNPFALTFDKWGYRYSSDSHSDPLYQLIPGADYPHFGKISTGIGFGPHMMDHDHGPTAIAGAALNDHRHFPQKYRNSFFQGNVRTNKIFRDSLAWHGATPQAIHKADFLTSDDPWFRPVAMTFGPDGALYIADFYNRIIGHYEVPLDHPGRDHRRGRIWRITYKGDDAKNFEATDWSTASFESLLEGLNDSHLKTRLQIADQLVYRIGQQAVNPVKQMLTNNSSSSVQRAHGLWILYRLEALSDDLLPLYSQDSSNVVQVHVMRILGEMAELSQGEHDLLLEGLGDESPHVQRAAVQALARHPRIKSTEPILTLLHQIPEYDTHLRYAARLALRNHLRKEKVMQSILASSWDKKDTRALADAMLGVNTEDAGDFLIDFIADYTTPLSQMEDYIRQIARNSAVERQGELVDIIREKYTDNLDYQQTLFRTVQEGLAQKGAPLGPEAKAWAIELASQYLDHIPLSKSTAWHNSLLSDSLNIQNPWVVTQIDAKDSSPVPIISSRPRGDHLTGILKSPVFTLPEAFSFLLLGEDSLSKTAPRNVVRLRLNETNKPIKNEILFENQSLRQIRWDLSEYAGNQAYLEVVDGSSEDTLAYIAIGNFSPSLIKVPSEGPSEVSDHLQFAAEITQTFEVHDFESPMQKLLAAKWIDVNVRAAAAQALMRLEPSKYSAVIEKLIIDGSEPLVLRESLGDMLGQQTSVEAMNVLSQIISNVPDQIQLSIARSLASTVTGAEKLLEISRSGSLPGSILADPTVEERMGTAKPEKIQLAYEQLIGKHESGDEDKESLIRQRLVNFNFEKASQKRGKEVFDIYCAACHQINGNGGVIGPQLDGIGGQGSEALAEAILAPNNSVPESFRLNTISLKDGKVQSGLFQRQEGALLIFANTDGEEFSIPQNDIAKREISSSSLMPSSYGRMLSEDQFHDLLAYLLNLD